VVRSFRLALIVFGLSACALESGGARDASLGDGGVDASFDAGVVVDLGMCVGSIPLSARQPLGSTCAPCLCANESDRPTITACDATCWGLVVCAGTNCDQTSPDFTQCLLSVCVNFVGAVSTVQPVGTIIRSCGPQCNLL